LYTIPTDYKMYVDSKIAIAIAGVTGLIG